MKAKQFVLFLKCTVWLLCATSKDAHAWASLPTGGDTHRDITKDVLNNSISGATYRDLKVSFAAQLRDGSNHESHDIPDSNDTQWWAPDPAAWFRTPLRADTQEGALSRYLEYDFAGAYLRIGYELHLLQDTTVPAHVRFCFHGLLPHKLDSLEVLACAFHSYTTTSTAWTYPFPHSGGTSTFAFWLDDSMDDDDHDDVGGETDDEGAGPIVDGPIAYGVPSTSWGTYGQPSFTVVGGASILDEGWPGCDEGIDYYGAVGPLSIIYEQLQQAYDRTLDRMILRSTELPPLVPDDETHGMPSLSAKIFGPDQPLHLSFVAMENRLQTVLVSIIADDRPIRSTGGMLWDGGAGAAVNLPAGAAGQLPWNGTISVIWGGEVLGTAQGEYLPDGQHTIRIEVEDQDGNLSGVRSRSVKFDKTKPTGSISVSVSP